jgi:hypothetical protein
MDERYCPHCLRQTLHLDITSIRVRKHITDELYRGPHQEHEICSECGAISPKSSWAQGALIPTLSESPPLGKRCPGCGGPVMTCYEPNQMTFGPSMVQRDRCMYPKTTGCYGP